jgi:CRISPR-associated protein Csm4
MGTFKVKFKVLSSVITPFQADTIWGHIAWACYYIWGEKKCKDFIQSHREGNPTLVSNAYPDGFMPVPYIPFVGGSDEVTDSEIFKRVKKQNLMRVENFEKIKDGLSSVKLFDVLKKEIEDEARKDKKFVNFVSETMSETILRNKIDRLSFTTTEMGELFATEETFYNFDVSMWFVIRTEFFSKGEIEMILKCIELNGFGADASVGKGRIKFTQLTEQGLPEAKDGNAFMSLSNFVPAEREFVEFEDAWYKLFVKFPKVGGYFALIDPFKKPILFFEAGSVFKVSKVKDYYGCLVENVHSNQDIVQYAYAFPVKVKLEV